jgi:hypothetical protein
MINRMTGEPILPARTANQYLARYWFAVAQVKLVHRARYWFAVRAGKIGSPVMRFITEPAHRLCITTLRSTSPHTLGWIAAYMVETGDLPRTLMRGSPNGTIEPDRHCQETQDLVE